MTKALSMNEFMRAWGDKLEKLDKEPLAPDAGKRAIRTMLATPSRDPHVLVEALKLIRSKKVSWTESWEVADKALKGYGE